MPAAWGGFAIGAFQIYRAKLRRADAVDAVQGGLYRYIRHPQYLALVVASVSMVLIWPRYLVLVLTVTVVFIYIALAKAEEAICLRRFPAYAGYMEGTEMFLPVRLPRNLLLPADAGVMRRVASWGLAYAVALGLALLAATGLRTLALDSLYAMSAGGDVYVSVVEIGDGDLAAVGELARTAPGAQEVIGDRGHLLNYVVPANMYISEIPVAGSPCGPAGAGSYRELSAARGILLRRPTSTGVLTQRLACLNIQPHAERRVGVRPIAS